MKMIAKTIQGREFTYSRQSTHAVSNAGANAICAALNAARYGLNAGEIWHVYDCSGYELDYTAAGAQTFARRNGRIIEKRTRYF